MKCRQQRKGRAYTIRLGVRTSVTSKAAGLYTERTTKYRILGSRNEFVCGRCALTHLVIGYTLPLLVCVGAELVM
ncbi:MAG: hypothetical protein QOF84_1871, partial [Streptomyces sp.]|nr:hypothetical protein [Streptomyces sp.]